MLKDSRKDSDRHRHRPTLKEFSETLQHVDIITGLDPPAPTLLGRCGRGYLTLSSRCCSMAQTGSVCRCGLWISQHELVDPYQE
ncbi:hypothetical protein ABIE89_000391 [Bradyrhizobium niftali]